MKNIRNRNALNRQNLHTHAFYEGMFNIFGTMLIMLISELLERLSLFCGYKVYSDLESSLHMCIYLHILVAFSINECKFIKRAIF